ncbi:MAG: phosphocarrier protein HPr [Verrucomicrobiaceae bacterium]|nr:phosphocarrier protein HPr [Verrucomicrobiaceae bacterium]
MISKKITIINKLGLHARAAAKLVSTTAAFRCQIRAGLSNRMVDAKSIMAVMMLAASKGTDLDLEFDGDDELVAHDAVVALINNRFGEAE